MQYSNASAHASAYENHLSNICNKFDKNKVTSIPVELSFFILSFTAKLQKEWQIKPSTSIALELFNYFPSHQILSKFSEIYYETSNLPEFQMLKKIINFLNSHPNGCTIFALRKFRIKKLLKNIIDFVLGYSTFKVNVHL